MRSTSIGRMFAVGTVFLFFIPSARATLVDGLISHYTFDGTSGVVVDSTGFQNGTNYGATRGVAGKIGNAFQFDGVNDYVDTLLPGDIPAASTISVWINAVDNNRTNQIYGSVDTTDFGKDGFVAAFWAFIGAAGLDYYSSNNYLGNVQGSDNAILPDTWTHLAVTVDSSNQVGIYVNGILDSTTGSLSVSPTSHDRALMFGKGAFSGGGSHCFEGYLDDVKIWDRALSAEEVAQVAAIPETSTLAIWGLFALCGLGLITARRRRKRMA